jgi:hypothetical protein
MSYELNTECLEELENIGFGRATIEYNAQKTRGQIYELIKM